MILFDLWWFSEAKCFFSFTQKASASHFNHKCNCWKSTDPRRHLQGNWKHRTSPSTDVSSGQNSISFLLHHRKTKPMQHITEINRPKTIIVLLCSDQNMPHTPHQFSSCSQYKIDSCTIFKTRSKNTIFLILHQMFSICLKHNIKNV